MRPRTRADDEQGVVVPSRLMLVAIVVVAIAAVMYAATSPGGKDTANAQGSSSTPTPSKKATKPLGTVTPSASPTITPSAAPTKKPVVVKRNATYVQVFNNSGRTGLASRTAGKASGVGWKVVGSDNWYGTVPATTVYYPAKLQAAAKTLARDLGIRRLKPAVSPMRNDRLTVILTDDYRA